MKKFIKILFFASLLLNTNYVNSAENSAELLKVDWSFNSFFGKFDRDSLQRGYQV